MRTFIYYILFFFSISTYCQKDTVIQYITYKGLPTKKLSNAHYYRVQTKESDSLYKMMQFKKSGKLMWVGYSTTPDRKNSKIGQMIDFDRNDSIQSIRFFNKQGQIHGKVQAWFDNRKKNYEGRYINGKREGLWRYYHYNGRVAQQGFFKNDSLVKAAYFDEEGNKMPSCMECRDKVEFKGGMNKFRRDFRKLMKRVAEDISKRIKSRYQFKILISFIIDIDGKVRYVEVDDTLPLQNRLTIINGIKNMEGWQPKIVNNRKVPSYFRIPVTLTKDEQDFETF